MKKLLIIIPILLLAIGGGFMLAQGKKDSGSAAATITAEKASEAALALFPGTVVGFEFDGDDRKPHYEIDIESATERVEVEVNAETAKAVITEREALKANKTTLKADVTEANAIDTAVRYFAAQSDEDIDLNGDMKQYVTKIELDEDDKVLVYDIELRTASTKADIEVNAKNGEVVSFEKEAIKVGANDSTVTEAISLQDAIDLALSKATGTVTKAEFDKDDNKYEIEIRNGKMEYEFEIDVNGNITSYEEDLDND